MVSSPSRPKENIKIIYLYDDYYLKELFYHDNMTPT